MPEVVFSLRSTGIIRGTFNNPSMADDIRGTDMILRVVYWQRIVVEDLTLRLGELTLEVFRENLADCSIVDEFLR